MMIKVFVLLVLCVCGGFTESTQDEKIADVKNSVVQMIDVTYNKTNQAIKDALSKFLVSTNSSFKEVVENGDATTFQRSINDLVNGVNEKITNIEKSTVNIRKQRAIAADVNIRYITDGRKNQNYEITGIINESSDKLIALAKEATDVLKRKFIEAAEEVTHIIIPDNLQFGKRVIEIYKNVKQSVETYFQNVYTQAYDGLNHVKERINVLFST